MPSYYVYRTTNLEESRRQSPMAEDDAYDSDDEHLTPPEISFDQALCNEVHRAREDAARHANEAPNRYNGLGRGGYNVMPYWGDGREGIAHAAPSPPDAPARSTAHEANRGAHRSRGGVNRHAAHDSEVLQAHRLAAMRDMHAEYEDSEERTAHDDARRARRETARQELEAASRDEAHHSASENDTDDEGEDVPGATDARSPATGVESTLEQDVGTSEVQQAVAHNEQSELDTTMTTAEEPAPEER